MPHAHNEDHLVEKPAIGLFAGLGSETMAAIEKKLAGHHRPVAPRKTLQAFTKYAMFTDT
jgi:hypothetical protein